MGALSRRQVRVKGRIVSNDVWGALRGLSLRRETDYPIGQPRTAVRLTQNETGSNLLNCIGESARLPGIHACIKEDPRSSVSSRRLV